jgi:hypothetical protein
MPKPGEVVKVGHWLYGDSVRCRVEIQYADIRYGSPDYEDPPELQEDVPGDWYVVSIAPPTDPENCPPSWKTGGNSPSIQDAVESTEQLLRENKLTWET